MKRHPYTYLVLRHTGGIDGGESLNVGVILCCPTLNTVVAKFRTEAGRLAAAFPEIDERDFTARMTKLTNRAAVLGGNPGGYAHALDFAKALLAQNEAARLNWELVERAGVTAEPMAELDHLFKDLVSARDEAFGEKFMLRQKNTWGLHTVPAVAPRGQTPGLVKTAA